MIFVFFSLLFLDGLLLARRVVVVVQARAYCMHERQWRGVRWFSPIACRKARVLSQTFSVVGLFFSAGVVLLWSVVRGTSRHALSDARLPGEANPRLRRRARHVLRGSHGSGDEGKEGRGRGRGEGREGEGRG